MARTSHSCIKVCHIDDVQELCHKTTIPDRFVRDVTDRPTLPTSYDSSSLGEVPTIDLAKISNGSFTEILTLATACEKWGYFQVINHGLEANLLDCMENKAMDFFMLPAQAKQKYQMTKGNVQGYGQAFVFSDQQKLDWCNMFALGVEPRSMRSPNLWPTELEMFSETIESYQKDIRKLCMKLLEYIAISLNLRAEAFEAVFGESVQAVRMNYYPACPRPDLVLGLSPHSDGSALTILQQKKGSPVGLQFLKDNNWLSVQPLPNALVVNIGDTLEVLTNGKYKSVEHRAVANKDMDRLSIVTFYAPSYEVEIEPMSEFVNQGNPKMYKRYKHGDYSRHYISNKLQGKKSLEFAKLETNIVA